MANPATDETKAYGIIDSLFKKEPLQKAPPPSFRDGTIEIMKIIRNWNGWSKSFQDYASPYLLKKSSPYNLYKPSMAAKVIRNDHLLPNWVETPNFSIEWGNNLQDSDSGTDSVKIINCSWGPPCKGVPDLVDKWADYFEEVWNKEIEDLGFKVPTGAGSYLYEIYIANTQDKVEGNNDDNTPSLNSKFLGITATYCDSTVFGTICKGDISNSYSFIVVNGYIKDQDMMKVTAAHEFFHAIQFAYPSIDGWFNENNLWWIEATATWMEDIVYDNVNDYYQNIRHWLHIPWVSLTNADGTYGDHEYGDALFIIFMTEIYLKTQSIADPVDFVKYVWESGSIGIDAIDTVIKDIYGKAGFIDAFKKFIALNGIADIGQEAGGYEEGAQYGRAELAAPPYEAYPVEFTSISGDRAPQILGANYVKFLSPDNMDHILTVYFDGFDNVPWSAILVKVRSDGSGFEENEIPLELHVNEGCYSVENFGTKYNEVLLGVTVLPNTVFNGSAPYRYKASIDETCPESTTAYMTQNTSTTSSGTEETLQKDSRCFIATAAFGPDSWNVKILREFRDEYLRPYRFGQFFVKIYYHLSPPVAAYIHDHFVLRIFTVITLMPVVIGALILIIPLYMKALSIIFLIAITRYLD